MAEGDEETRGETAVEDGPVPGPGRRLGPYRLGRALGQGAAGAIHAAVHAETGAQVAIKLGLRAAATGDPAAAEDPAALLRREAGVLTGLSHPNIVGFEGFREIDGTACLVLQRLEGTDLETALRRRGAPDEAVLHRLLGPLLDALAYLHGTGVVHRDLKPGNLFLDAAGKPVIIDFGAACRRGDPAGAPSRWSYATAGYGAPEQYLEDGVEGPWTDVYGLGAILYRAIGGRPPAPALSRLRGEAMAPAVELGKGRYSRAFLAAVDRALELDTGARPRDVVSWKRSLIGSNGEMSSTDPGSAAAAADDVLDSYPPTERVERQPASRIRAPEPTFVEAPTVPAPERARRIPAWAVLAAAAVGFVAAGWLGWTIYERNFKMEWTVDAGGGGDVDSINEAIARAPENAVIVIRPGTYAESLTLDRPVHLQADPTAGESPLVVPPEGPCAVITAATGSIVGLSLGGPGGAAAGAGPVPCLDIVSSNVRVAGNQILRTTGPGIRIREGANPTIQANRISEVGGAGILLSSGAAGTIVENTIERAGKSGIIVRGGAKPQIAGNLIDGSGQAGVLFAEGAEGSFEGNVIKGSGASGIEVRASANPVVAGNRVEAARQAGVFVYDLGRGRFHDNELVGSGFSGLVITGGGAPEFVDNVIRESAEHGILVVDNGGGILAGNTISENKGHAIALGRGTTAELGKNALDGNKKPDILDGWVPRR